MCIRDRLHIEEPEPPAPVTEPEKTFEEVLDEHPVSIQVNGQWQTIPNAKAAEEASYEEYKDNLRRTAASIDSLHWRFTLLEARYCSSSPCSLA